MGYHDAKHGHPISPHHDPCPTHEKRPLLCFNHLGGEDMSCPICHKTVPSDEADVHLVMCLTRPKITYNGVFFYHFSLYHDQLVLVAICMDTEIFYVFSVFR